MATLKGVRQTLKALADDTRLRILSLLNKRELNVSELRSILGCSQPMVSKHLTRLRLLGIVSDRREGANVYYFLGKPVDRNLENLIRSAVKNLSNLAIVKRDAAGLKKKLRKAA